MKQNSNAAAWVGAAVSVLLVLGGLVLAWHKLDTKLDLLGWNIDPASATVAQDSKRIKTLEDFLLTKNPDLLPLVTAKYKAVRVAKRNPSATEVVSTEQFGGGEVTVHHFATRGMLGAGVAADAAEMPRAEKSFVGEKK